MIKLKEIVMKQAVIVLLLMCQIIQVSAQSEKINKIEHGLIISTKLISNRNFAEGFGIDLGYFASRKVGNKGIISVDLRFGYAHVNNHYENAGSINDAFSQITTIRTGIVNYKNISLEIPLKYRWQFKKDGPLYLMIGYNPFFNLHNKTNWNFDEYDYDRTTFISTLKLSNQNEELNQSIYGKEYLIGFGYKNDKLMLELNIGSRGNFYGHRYINRMSAYSIGLSGYYYL